MAYVLVVEDEADHRHILSDVLRWAGHEVRTVPDVGAARVALRRQRPDLVILDLHMTEGESTFVLLAELSGGDAPSRIPIIACSGDLDNFDRAKADDRFAAVFPKPFAISDLISSVNQLTGTSGAHA
jgi:DNA-binding response OmpR family regulator